MTDIENDIAITGMTGRFPGASSVEELWRNVTAGVDSISRFSRDQLVLAGVPGATLESPDYVPAAGVLAGATEFDAAFFGMARGEAARLDPQQRLLLQESWRACELAGHGDRRRPARVGVFASVSAPNWDAPGPAAQEMADYVQRSINRDQDFVATRIAHRLNLTGPAMTVQTACSSSLVALHLACQSLLAEECDAAVVAAASLWFPQETGYLYQRDGIFSPDGHCRAYDADARGTVRGSGVVAVVLKRLDAALRDDDPVCAVVKGSAVNNDGREKVGFTAPSVAGQATVIAEAHGVAGVEPETIAYVEGHGTGTPIGDPIEIAALREAFGPAGVDCVIGSIKSNIGHLDAAAGLAGVVKAALAVRHAVRPGTAHFSRPNPALMLEGTRFRITAASEPWPGATRRAGVSSFGMGGTNAHAVLEAPPVRAPTRPSGRRRLLRLAAAGPEEADALAGELARHLRDEDHVVLDDVAHTLAVGRTPLQYRHTAVADTPHAAAKALRRLPPGSARRAAGRTPRVVFAFPGQGGADPAAVARAAETSPVFGEELDKLLAEASHQCDVDLREVILGQADPQRTLTTDVLQPALLVVEVALTRAWRRLDVEPVAVVGHSVGELAAACVAGVLSYADAVRVAAVRGRLMQATAEGAMSAVLLGERDLLERLEEGRHDVSVAAVNGPTSCVVSGPAAGVAAFEEDLLRQGVQTRRLKTSRAFHSRLIEPVLDDLQGLLSGIGLRAPDIRLVSSMTGAAVDGDQLRDPGYWAMQARRPVRFTAALEALAVEAADVILEVGPGAVLTHFASSAVPLTAVASVATADDDLLPATAALWETGVDVRDPDTGAARVALPATPFRADDLGWPGGDDPPAAESPATRELTIDVPAWRRVAPRRSDRGRGGERWLLVGGSPAIGDGLAAVLEAGGQAVDRAAVDVADLAGDPGASSSFADELRAAIARGSAPDHVVHLAALDGAEEAVTAMLDAAFFSVLGVGRALDVALPGRPVALHVVTAGAFDVNGGDCRHPFQAMAHAASAVMAEELATVSCSGVDLEPGALDLAIAGGELLASAGGTVTALRGGRRWRRGFVPVDAPSPEESALAARPGGVYLVTGGLGAVGGAIARHLAERWDAKLVLMGRSAAEDHPLADQLRERGFDVVAVAGDVTRDEDVRRAVAAADALGGLAGVVHAAGTAGGGLVATRRRADAMAVIGPKVLGALAIDRAVAGRELDFVLHCSSLAAVAGGVGMADYAAANAYLDAAAAASRGPSTVSILWDAWRDGGMTARAAEQDGGARARQRAGLSDREGTAGFDAALALGAPQVCVTKGGATARLAQEQAESAALGIGDPGPSHGLAGGDASPPPSHLTLSDHLGAIWSALLGVEEIAPDDDFLSLGGTSLLAMQVASRIRHEIGVQLSLDVVLGAATLSELCEAVAAARAELPSNGAGVVAPAPSAPGPEPGTGAMRLLCFPWAGASEAMYRPWGRRLDPELELVPVAYPGRTTPALAARRLPELVERILEQDPDRFRGRFALFGHSLGGLVAFETARALRRRGLTEPEHLFVSACRPPHRLSLQPAAHDMGDAELVQELRRLGGLGDEMLEHEDFIASILPGLRVDLEVFGTYEPVAEEPLDIPLTVLAGDSDVLVPVDELPDWGAETTGPFALEVLPGDHFYFHEETEAVLRTLETALAERVP